MNIKNGLALLSALFASLLLAGCTSPRPTTPSRICPIKLDGLFYETAAGRTPLPVIPFTPAPGGLGQQAETNLPDGRVVTISVKPEGNGFAIHLSATPDGDILKWGLAVAAAPGEYFTSLMERMVATANTRPDLKPLEAQVRAWFEKNKVSGA